MKIEVVQLPPLLSPSQLTGRSVVVFDVLRATTTMTAALAAGVKEIRIFGTTQEARSAAGAFEGRKILCGEAKCVPPPGFDLGNSPGQFNPDAHAGATMFMATTNGTRAIVAAQSAHQVYVGCLLNAAAAAKMLREIGRDVTLLCSGTDGAPAEEDQLGAGAVIDRLLAGGACELADANAAAAHRLYLANRSDPNAMLTRTPGGRNILAVNLSKDIDFAARLDLLDNIGQLYLNPLRIHPASPNPAVSGGILV